MFEFVEYIGIIAFAVSGFLVGVKNSLDLLGVLISVFLTALGGGLIRDVILGKTPYSFSHNEPIILISLVIVVMLLFKLYNKSLEDNFWFIFSDSLGLVAFSLSGATLALEAHYNLTGILALAFISGVGGGIVRDIIINEVPFIFKSGFYGTVTLIVATLLYFCSLLNFLNFFSLILIFILGVVIRLVAYYNSWSVPKI